MSKRLVEIVQQYVAKEKGAIAKLAAVVGKDTQTVKRWLKAGRIPDAHDRYLVARQCGSTDAEAVQMAHGSDEREARTA